MKPYVILFTLVLSGGLLGCSTSGSDQPAGLPIRYHNAQYDLTVFLPASWKGYSVRTQQWAGETYSPEKDTKVVLARGPLIVLRNPLWKMHDSYQDMPIYIFTRQQWNDIHDGKYSAVGAGGVIYELWHNDQYVFGMHSRYNSDDSVNGWKDVQQIVHQNCALHPESHLHDI
jgi:hypothetical protein